MPLGRLLRHEQLGQLIEPPDFTRPLRRHSKRDRSLSCYGPTGSRSENGSILLKKSKIERDENSPNCNPMEHRRSTPSQTG
jgi:hypothetical protein